MSASVCSSCCEVVAARIRSKAHAAPLTDSAAARVQMKGESGLWDEAQAAASQVCARGTSLWDRAPLSLTDCEKGRVLTRNQASSHACRLLVVEEGSPLEGAVAGSESV
eukprot:4773842-Pleurochrysis_carterae.AAC.3